MKATPRLYRVVSTMGLPLASLYLMWRSRKQPAYREFWDERFAWGTYPLRRPDKPRIWLHAVSVGETNAAKPLLEAILNAWPECDVLLTHMTPTGREAGERLVKLAPGRVLQSYLPYDAPYAVEKFFRQTRPTLGIIMETEVWPNVMREAAKRNIPMVLANARESEKSRAQAEKFIEVMRPAFASFSAVLAQSEEDKERFESLGARNVTVCGSLKFDLKPDLSQRALASDWRGRIAKKILLLASTRDGEEERFAEAFLEKYDLLKDAMILLVPRHPQRFKDAKAAFEGKGFKVCCRSEIRDADEIPADTKILLGDSMGEMSFYCALADMTAMGGSFEPYGSQNVIEPAMAGSPIIVGPSTYNFAKIIHDGIEAGAMCQVETPAQAIDLFAHWLAHPEERDHISEAARRFSSEYAGATDKMMQILEELWQTARKKELQMY